MELIVRANEAAKLLRTSPNAIYKMLENGELTAYRDGNSWSIPTDCLKEYVINRAKEETERRRK